MLSLANTFERCLQSFCLTGVKLLPKPMKRVLNWAISKCVDTQPEPIRIAALDLLNEMQICRISRYSTKRLKELREKKGLKIHLGCGSDIRLGWINIDLQPLKYVNIAGQADGMFIMHDLRLGLPLEESSCDYIYSSHFFEHLEYRCGLKLMRDCYLVLRPAGVFRAALPNYRAAFQAYLQQDHKYFDLIDICGSVPSLESGTETLVDLVNYSVYQNGEHKYIYDEEKIVLLLRKIGFTSVTLSSYQKDIDLGTPERLRYSFYVQAVK